MQFKSDRIAAEWNDPRLTPLLKQIAQEAGGRALERWEWLFFVTCIFRTPQENDALYSNDGKHLTGVHTLWRGLDVRILGVDPSAVMDITTFVNDRWEYNPEDDGHRVALLEGGGRGSSAPHIHLQVHPATKEVTAA